jgi:hypothetical protein
VSPRFVADPNLEAVVLFALLGLLASAAMITI